jgi:tricarboxylate carrier
MAQPPLADIHSVDLSKPRYDQGSFGGRLRHMLDVADPRCLLPGLFFGMPLLESTTVMTAYRTHTLPATYPVERLWLAKKVSQSAVHPDTGEIIPAPFRMSGFAVFGTPIMVGMLMPNPTMLGTIFWQALNQTHNACVNYSNRNASAATTVQDILTGYCGAVLSSVTIAVGLNQAVKRASMAPHVKAIVSRFVPYPAVATASSLNMLLMRRTELKSGIVVKSADGTEYGPSQKAASLAIYQTLITRVVLPAPLLLIPPITMMALDKTPIFRALPRARMPVEALVCVLAFVFGLPFAIAVFPQEGSAKVTDLEEHFHHIRDRSGNPVTTLFFNKGL